MAEKMVKVTVGATAIHVRGKEYGPGAEVEVTEAQETFLAAHNALAPKPKRGYTKPSEPEEDQPAEDESTTTEG